MIFLGKKELCHFPFPLKTQQVLFVGFVCTCEIMTNFKQGFNYVWSDFLHGYQIISHDYAIVFMCIEKRELFSTLFFNKQNKLKRV